MARTRSRVLAVLIAVVASLPSSCKKSEPPQPPSPYRSLAGFRPRPKPTQINPAFSKKHQDIQRLLATRDGLTLAEWEQQQEDRKEFVRPAPAGFVPQRGGEKLKLFLIPRETRIPRDGHFWYRVELVNLSSAPVEFRESGLSFFKQGKTYDSHFKFHVTPPGGKEHYLMSPIAIDHPLIVDEPDIPGWKWMTASRRREAIRKANLKASVAQQLSVTLLPGERLVSRAWQYTRVLEAAERHDKGLDPYPRPPGEFRQLYSDPFEKPGVYRLRLVYDHPPPPPPQEDEIQLVMRQTGSQRESVLRTFSRMGKNNLPRMESNAVAFEVLP